jgi:hypothetical protein
MDHFVFSAPPWDVSMRLNIFHDDSHAAKESRPSMKRN